MTFGFVFCALATGVAFSVDKLANQLVDRTMKMPSLHNADLDNVTLGKVEFLSESFSHVRLPGAAFEPCGSLASFPIASFKIPGAQSHFPVRNPTFADSQPIVWDAQKGCRVLVISMNDRSMLSSQVPSRPSVHLPGESDIIITQSPGRSDLRLLAEFLSYNYYHDLSACQQREIKDIYKKTLEGIFEAKVGKARPLAALFVAKEDEEIVGSVLLDCWMLSRQRNTGRNTVRPLRKSDDLQLEDIVPLLLDLAVRKDRRGQGLARQLLAVAEEQAKAWNYTALYLSVERDNALAVKLYDSLGYNVVCEQEEETMVPDDKFVFQQKKRWAYHMSKQLAHGTDSNRSFFFTK